MKTASISKNNREHQNALVKRRIKFVVEKGAMARLFKKGMTKKLQQELFLRLKLNQLSSINDQERFDKYIKNIVCLKCWAKYTGSSINDVRWAHFAKLLNIVIYELVSNREIFKERDWKSLHRLLHIPIDSIVTEHISKIETSFQKINKLKGMSENKYWEIQYEVRRIARKNKVHPIWFEAAWSD